MVDDSNKSFVIYSTCSNHFWQQLTEELRAMKGYGRSRTKSQKCETKMEKKFKKFANKGVGTIYENVRTNIRSLIKIQPIDGVEVLVLRQQNKSSKSSDWNFNLNFKKSKTNFFVVLAWLRWKWKKNFVGSKTNAIMKKNKCFGSIKKFMIIKSSWNKHMTYRLFNFRL